MVEKFEEEERNMKIISETFISKYFLDVDRKYSIDFYLSNIMRLSIIEKIISEYFFKFDKKSKDYLLYPLLDFYSENSSKKSLFNSYMKYFIEIFDEDNPLFFYAEISKEFMRLLKNEDVSTIKFDENVLKIEFLLAWHLENNFLQKNILDNFTGITNDNIYLNKGITNYIYSINSLYTVNKFLEIFEKQNLCTRIEGNIELINDYFCTEKVYYFYCDNTGNKKLSCGNFVKYLIEQLNSRLNKYKNRKINNYDIENYILMNLFFINNAITNYPFYLSKEPEIEEIFKLVEKYKSWPFPISHYCNNLIENIVNENTFQGISVLNKIRQMYYIDLLDKDITSIDVKDFRYTLIINSNEWEKRHSDGGDTYFNLLKFLNYLKERPRKRKNKKLILKEILIKLLITIVFNSIQPISDELLKMIYKKYMPNYKKNDGSEEKDKIKCALDKLLKIIDVGFDKSINDFDKEINILADKIIKIGKIDVKDDDSNILNNEFLLPIDSMRNYLKPEYCEIKKIYRDINTAYEALDLFDIYIKQFKHIVNTYFKYLLKDSEDTMIKTNLSIVRKNFFKSFRINILLIEEQNTINDFIENIQKKVLNAIDKKISDNDYKNFWSLFVDDKKEILPQYLIYIIPSYDSNELNPFRLYLENDSNNYSTYLSEYIANNDYIYKNIIFMPFVSTCDKEQEFHTELNSIKTDKSIDNTKTNPFCNVDIKCAYSFLKKPLDFYLGDSNGIMNLDLYKISINDNIIEKVIWKNIDILDKNNDSSRITKITMKCVDYLGISKKEKIEINIGNNNFHIKLFNLFFKNNVPFSYNMNSNNGWLEMFLDDKYDPIENEKILNFSSFLQKNKETRFYEENNIPQTDLETRYKNYKVKEILIESNSPNIVIKCDDYEDIEYYEKIDLTTNKKNNNELKLKIKIEAFKVNDKKYTLPVATFVSI